MCRRHVTGSLLALAACLALIPSTTQADDRLTFEDRVKAQAAIQKVYQSHQIGDARPFEEAMPRAVLEAQVAAYLRKSAALEKYWQTPITREMLLAEVARMRRGSRMPERLAEIEGAIGGDPLLVEECLARPVLADRLLRNFFAFDQAIHAPARDAMERERGRLSRGGPSPREGDRSILEIDADPDAVVAAPGAPGGGHAGAAAAGAGPDGSAVERLTAGPAEFARWRARLPQEPGDVGQVEEERDRFLVRVLLDASPRRLRFATHAVPKRPFDDWWREVEGVIDPASVEPVGSRADALPPAAASAGACVAGSWDNGILDDVPDPRSSQSGVWTGNLLIVWGGVDSARLNSGGRYDPSTDTWQPTSTTGAPEARYRHLAVWTGSRMVVWGGVGNGPTANDGGPLLNTGGRYDPVSDTWQSIAVADAPTARLSATAVWTGTEMIVWGGAIAGNVYVNTGGRYNPASDTWLPLPPPAPAARANHAAVFIAGRMMVWGGIGAASQALDTGGLYDPASDTWMPTETAGAPSPRSGHTLIAAGGRAVVWGGTNDQSGGRYNPGGNTWEALSTSGAPSPRSGFAAVGAGAEMIVWGGSSLSTGQFFLDGGRYNPGLDTWAPVTSANAPSGRRDASAVWSGSRMIVWGGSYNYDSTGGRYDPSTDSWTPTSTSNAPAPRSDHAAVWTGNQFIVWGGVTNVGAQLDTGGRYDLALDAWQPTSRADAPAARRGHSAVWSGSRMIVWGGGFTVQALFHATGGRYDPLTDTWSATSTSGAPVARYHHTAVWTGREMIVWGGNNIGSGFNSGGRYNPVTDTWAPTALADAPSIRDFHKAIWTGREMIIWGGCSSPESCSGGRYNPATNSWNPTSLSGAPFDNGAAIAVWSGAKMLVWSPVLAGYLYDPTQDLWSAASSTGKPTTESGHSGVWTGREMIVWGGVDSPTGFRINSGSGYDPAGDSWTSVTTAGAPTPRNGQSAFWTGNRMLIWGGNASTYLTSGGLYCACSGPVTVYYQDADGDGFGDANMPFPSCSQPAGYVPSTGDCSDADASVWAIPSEARSLVFTDAATLQWAPPASPGATSVTYDVIRSNVPNDFTTAPVCVASNTSATSAIDVDSPGPYYYLVRAQNACPGGLGPLGTWSNGTPRTAPDCP